VFRDLDFLQEAKISVIRVHVKADMGLLIFQFAWIFRTSNAGFGWQNMVRGDAMLIFQRTRFYFRGFLRLCQFSWKSIKKCDRESANRWIHTPTQTGFTALHALHSTRSSHEKAVRPSVRLSVKRVICDKTKESCAHILIPHERSFILL